MYWIHGGGFGNGDGNDGFYGPGYLLDRDVILVTVQYRMGPLGFFDLGKDSVAGNQVRYFQTLDPRCRINQPLSDL